MNSNASVPHITVQTLEVTVNTACLLTFTRWPIGSRLMLQEAADTVEAVLRPCSRFRLPLSRVVLDSCPRLGSY